MGLGFAQGLILTVTASMLAVSIAFSKPNPSDFGFNYTDWARNNGFFHQNATRGSKRIIVGGSERWHFGFNYTDWALKNGPFYLNDTLVFKYDPPNGSTRPHSVYLLPDIWSFLTCDLRRAKLVANVTQGSGRGFEFGLKGWHPHYFACGEGNGFHCKDGLMKFFVMPWPRGWHH